MTVARQPRLCLAPAFHLMFGRGVEVGWRQELLRSEPDLLSASYRQHLLAWNVRHAMREHEENQRTLAGRIGMDVETLRRKIRGETLVSWQDASRLALAYPGLDIIPAPQQLLPQLLL